MKFGDQFRVEVDTQNRISATSGRSCRRRQAKGWITKSHASGSYLSVWHSFKFLFLFLCFGKVTHLTLTDMRTNGLFVNMGPWRYVGVIQI
jgi:hypothetical protein